MHHLRPHFALFSIMLIMVAVGIALFPGYTGAVLGATAASITDPMLLVAATLIGMAALRHTLLLAAILIVSGIAFAVWISIINADLGAELTAYSIVIKVVSFLFVGFLSNAVARLATSSTKREK